MEDLVKAAILMLGILVVVNWISGDRKRNDRKKKAAGTELEVPHLSPHGYMTQGYQDGCSPATHHGSRSDLGCGDFSGDHHH
jgi:hypothetical protein